MVGSGSEGIKVVNGTIFKKEFDNLVQLNNDQQLIASVNKRGEAAKSSSISHETIISNLPA